MSIALRTNPPRRQRGAALVTGLLIMLVMTLIGIAAMESSIIQGNLATNAQLSAVGFQVTEATLARATSYEILSKSMANKQDGYTMADIVEQISLDNQGGSASGYGATPTVTVTSQGEVDFCGILPPALTRGLSLDADQSITNNAYTRYVFDLAVQTKVGNGNVVQASNVHRQRNTRLMLSKQGGGILLCNI